MNDDGNDVPIDNDESISIGCDVDLLQVESMFHDVVVEQWPMR